MTKQQITQVVNTLAMQIKSVENLQIKRKRNKTKNLPPAPNFARTSTKELKTYIRDRRRDEDKDTFINMGKILFVNNM